MDYETWGRAALKLGEVNCCWREADATCRFVKSVGEDAPVDELSLHTGVQPGIIQGIE